MPALMSTMIHLQPGSPAAYAFLALATLTVITAGVVIAGKARRWVSESDPRRHDDRSED